MSLNAIQSHVRSLLDGLPSPYFPQAKAWIAPPVPNEASEPQIFVWGQRGNEHRHAGGRPFGVKKARHRLDIYVVVADEIDDPHADAAFPLILDSVVWVLRTTQMPVLGLTDPDTGEQSNLMEIGETIDTDYSVPHTIQDQRYLWYTGLIQTEVEEQIRG